MLSSLAVLVIALAVLIRSADWLVKNAALLARRFDVSELVVGLLITAVGTSLPELAASLAAAVAGSPGIAVGNVVGSNIANLGLVLGAAALARPVETDAKMLDRDGFIMVASAALFFILVLDNRLGRFDAALFLLLYLAYTAFVVRSDREGVEHRFKHFLEFVADFEYAAPIARGLKRRRGRAERAAEERLDLEGVGRELAAVAVSLAALILAARFVVLEAVRLAGALGIPQSLIGLSLVAVGTSLPELVVAVTAARRGKSAMVVGNVLGSNIANLLLVAGLAALVRPLEVAELSVVYTTPIMLFFSIGLLRIIRSDWRMGRSQGAIAVVAYVAFLAAAFVYGWS